MVVWGWRVQSGLVMNIHVPLYVLPNRKWHHRGDSTHPKKKKKWRWWGAEERKEETGRRKNRESRGKVMEEYGKWRQTERGVGDQTEWQGSIK